MPFLSHCQKNLPCHEGHHGTQAKTEHERAERLAEELRRRRGNREDIRAQVEREAEASVKLQMQQRDFEWRQKYQVLTISNIFMLVNADTLWPWAGCKGLQNIMLEHHSASPRHCGSNVGICCLLGLQLL